MVLIGVNERRRQVTAIPIGGGTARRDKVGIRSSAAGKAADLSGGCREESGRWSDRRTTPGAGIGLLPFRQVRAANTSLIDDSLGFASTPYAGCF